MYPSDICSNFYEVIEKKSQKKVSIKKSYCLIKHPESCHYEDLLAIQFSIVLTAKYILGLWQKIFFSCLKFIFSRPFIAQKKLFKISYFVQYFVFFEGSKIGTKSTILR